LNTDKFNKTDIDNLDKISSDEIKENLKNLFIGKKIIHFEDIDSTNSYAKEIGDSFDEGTVITCDRQVAGRGRLGRQWEAQEGSLCMSIILKPKISMYQVAKITQVCAAAISISLDELNVEHKIKWPNDLLINNKKICGILTEMNSDKDHVNYVVVGMGLNVNNLYENFPNEIKNVATSIFNETGIKFNKNIIAAKIMNNFELLYNEFVKNNNFKFSLDICKKKSNIIGKNINLIKNNNITSAKALSLGDDGELIVQYENGEIDSIISGEISVRAVEK